MKAGECQFRWRRTIGSAALGVLAFGVTTIAQTVTPRAPDQKRDGMVAEGATARTVVIYDDATIARGGASAVVVEAPVFSQPNDSGFGWFMKSDDTFGYGTWAMQQIFGNGFSPGDEITSYTLRVFHSSFDDSTIGDSSYMVELWDGDPFAGLDTVCSTGGVPAPIAGTAATFSIPYATVGDIQVVLPAPVAIGCDRVWMVLTYLEGCRSAWRIAGTFGVSTWDQPPDIGFADAVHLLWACEQFGGCNTANGYNSGFCCNAPALTCDHTDGTNECDPNGVGPGGETTFCGDGGADYILLTTGAPDDFRSFVSGVFGAAQATMQLKPVGNTFDGLLDAGVTLTDDEITMNEGGHDLVLEVRLGDWDPSDTGVQLQAYQATLDSSGYTTGVQGSLTVNLVPCTANADCASLGAAATCSPPATNWPGFCGPGYIDTFGRPDYVMLLTLASLPAADVSTPDQRWGATTLPPAGAPFDDPDPYPAGGLYGGTLLLRAPSDAKGTFTVGFFPSPATNMVDQANQFIPLLGIIPAKITITTGRCCFNLQDLVTGGEGCLDQLMTSETCAQMPGVTLFNPDADGKTCADPCECDPAEPASFDDGDACTDDACIAGIPTHTPRDCSDGLTCTQDLCDSADPTGVGCSNPPIDIDDGLACTIDTCVEPGGAVHTPVDVDDGDPCTVDACNEPDGNITHIDVNADPAPFACPTGDPVADGCPAEATTCIGGACKCILCFNDEPLGCDSALACRADIGIAYPGGLCADKGAKVLANVMMGDSLQRIAGGQFFMNYDPSCMSFNSITGVAPYEFEFLEAVDPVAGTIAFAVGINPFADPPPAMPLGGQPLAQISFTKHSDCECCTLAFTSSNPDNTFYTNPEGQPICADPIDNSDLCGTDQVTISVPGDMKSNADCDFPTATVTWDAPSASSNCGAVTNIDCHGVHESGADMSALAMTGGEHPVGRTDYWCTATTKDVCGSESAVEGHWTVTVNDAQSLDVTVQLSPIMSGDCERCIDFELFSDCVQPPTPLQQNLFFGGLFDHVGHFTDVIKTPTSGQWVCITARDQLHTLRSCDFLSCVDGVYSATFKGDPVFGGNWLIGGNLDAWKKENPLASHDVIDILDFGQFVANFLSSPGMSSPCGSAGPHADVNCDGVVDALDFAFITMNFLSSSKDCCCGAAAGVTVPRTEISVRELRELGMGDLATADINHDGMVNLDDVSAFMAGDRPVKEAPARDRKGSGVRSR